jgi:hypothetical protein
LYGALARNHGGNGYHAFAKTPISGRPIATERKYATDHSALSTTGCARYTVALCETRPTIAWMTTNTTPIAISVRSRPRRSNTTASAR